MLVTDFVTSPKTTITTIRPVLTSLKEAHASSATAALFEFAAPPLLTAIAISVVPHG